MSENEKQNNVNSYLTFRLGEEEFGVHVGQVINILEMTSITKVPRSPYFMKGVINLRGKVLPIIDARLKFGMEEKAYTSNTCIIVMDLELHGETVDIGAIVDDVLSVVEIDKSQVEPPPGIGSKYKSEFIYGMAKVNEEFIMLIDMQKVISIDEMSQIAETPEIKSKASAVSSKES